MRRLYNSGMDFREHLLAYLPQEEVDGILSAQRKEQVHGLLLNTEKVDPEAFKQAFPHIEPIAHVPHGYRYSSDEYAFGKHPLFDLGAYYIQDPAAMLVAAMLKPREGARILDLCAAPGGKTIGTSLLYPGCTIISNDLSYPRAKELSGNVERMGRGNILVTCADFKDHYQNFKGAFDAIILDAPCSGSAMFRKNDLAEADWSMEKVQRCATIQKELLSYAYSMLAPGGILLYSTCSFSKDEDIDPILGLLKEHDDLSLCEMEDDPSFFHHPELPEAIFLFPHRYEGEGQFMVKLQKAGRPPLFAMRNRPAPKQNPLIGAYGLEGRDFEIKGNALYSMPRYTPTYHLPVLRYGVKIEEDGNPDFALARYLGVEDSIPLDDTQTKAYLSGLTFDLNAAKGYHAVSYQGLTLGWVKVSNGVAKNHYPKGLRRDYPKDLFPFFETTHR